MVRRASLSIVLFLSACFIGQAVGAQNDLGSRWPNELDVTSNPNWHVYVFLRDGVKYIQVNDLNGTVREVVATAGDQFLVLPMGADASRVNTQQETVQAGASGCQPPGCVGSGVNSAQFSAKTVTVTSAQVPQLVYRDNSVIVTVAMDATGSLQWTNRPSRGVVANTCEPPECGTVITPPQ